MPLPAPVIQATLPSSDSIRVPSPFEQSGAGESTLGAGLARRNACLAILHNGKEDRLACEAHDCHHSAPLKLADPIARHGAEASSNVLRQRSKRTKCGAVGATQPNASSVDFCDARCRALVKRGLRTDVERASEIACLRGLIGDWQAFGDRTTARIADFEAEVAPAKAATR
jgi:hypothetical protein